MLIAEVAQYLADNNLGSFQENGVSGSIFLECIPETPDEVIGIYSRPGIRGDLSTTQDVRGFQLIVRGTQNPKSALELAQSLNDLLHGFKNGRFREGGFWIVACLANQSGPAHIGRDQNGRHEYSLNFTVHLMNDNREV
ncbi:minor capsid protein [Candidatus Pacearchaeota archaeon]|jgi:hypothetical protein|nr:minor capsid protein [Candidatus Pacearchaeota archaeon]